MKKPPVLLIVALLLAAGSLLAQTPILTPATASGTPAPVQFTREEVNTAKEATALILNTKGSGTAFCISESGLFITCYHVVDKAGDGNLMIVVNPSQKDEKKYQAHVLRTFPESDLAVLKVDLDPKIPVLKLGDDSVLFETQQLFAFGYPFGLDLTPDSKSFPAISVNSGHITSLRRRGDALDSIQLDALLNPGNSGGPVLDEKGQVVGIVSSGVVGSGINYAIPLSLLKKAMSAPLISVVSPEVMFEKRFAPADFAIAIDWLAPQAAGPAVSLEITSDGQTRRTAAAKGKDGKYHALLSPLPPKSAVGKIKLKVTLTFESGSILGEMDDFPLTIQGQPKLLSQIQAITPADNGAGFVVDGTSVGALPELARMNVDFGGAVTTVDGQKAKSIAIIVPGPDAGPVTYKVTIAAANGGATLASAEGNVAIGPSPVAAISPTPPQLTGKPDLTDTRTIDLPSHLDDVVAAEDGRLLIFHLKDVRKLAVFDIVDLKMRGFIDLAEEPVMYAGGQHYLLVAYPSENLIVRYSLQTLQKDLTITNPMGEIKNLVMGYSSPRSALFVTGGGNLQAPTVYIFNVENMIVETSSKGNNDLDQLFGGDTGLVVRASADGRTYGFYRSATSPSGFNLVSYYNSRLSFFYKHESPGLIVPNADGSMIFTSFLGVFTPQYVPLIRATGAQLKGVTFMPSYHPAYYLSVNYNEYPDAKKQDVSNSVAVYMGRSDQPLIYLDDFKEMSGKDASLHAGMTPASAPMTPEKRYHFYPQLNLFITIPGSNDRLVVHPIDIKKILDDKGVDYLYVTTIPPQAKPLQRVRFKLDAVSKTGGATFALQSGPAGLTVSSDGTVDWQTPAKPVEESVIVTVKDKSGREIYDTFQISVTN